MYKSLSLYPFEFVENKDLKCRTWHITHHCVFSYDDKLIVLLVVMSVPRTICSREKPFFDNAFVLLLLA